MYLECLGLPYKNQLCLLTDNTVWTLWHWKIVIVITYMGTLCACLCLFVLCWLCSCVFCSWGCRVALLRNNWSFLYVWFYKINLVSLSIHYLSVYCKTWLPNLPWCVLYLIYKTYASMIRKEMPQITDQLTTDDKVQKKQRKRRKETQMATKRINHPPDLTSTQNDWSNNFYYKQWINNNRATAFKQPTPLGWVLKFILLANSSPISVQLVYALV